MPMRVVRVKLSDRIAAVVTALRQRLASQGEPTLVVFVYHGVTGQSQVARVSYGLHLEEQLFAEHCREIAKAFTPCHPSEFAALEEGAPPRAYALLTFDDVYDNVVTTALPILERFGLKCMLFLTTDYVATAKLFWWDRVRLAFLCAPYASLTIGDRHYELGTLSARERSAVAFEAVIAGMDATGREALVDELYEPVRRYIESVFGKAMPGFAALQAQSLARVAEHPLCRVGLHTASHPDLTLVTRDVLRDELERCQQWHQSWKQRNAEDICFPFGAANSLVESAAVAAGFCRGFSFAPHRAPYVRLPEARSKCWSIFNRCVFQLNPRDVKKTSRLGNVLPGREV